MDTQFAVKEIIQARLRLANYVSGIQNKILSLEVPTPPIRRDFVGSDGSFDETGYNLAMQQYEQEKMKTMGILDDLPDSSQLTLF